MYIVVREICTLTRLPCMEYVPRGGAFERPHIYCTSTCIYILYTWKCLGLTARTTLLLFSVLLKDTSTYRNPAFWRWEKGDGRSHNDVHMYMYVHVHVHDMYM